MNWLRRRTATAPTSPPVDAAALAYLTSEDRTYLATLGWEDPQPPPEDIRTAGAAKILRVIATRQEAVRSPAHNTGCVCTSCEAAAGQMATGDQFLDRYYSPGLISRGE